jgi:alpha-D-xyloside xylohydrolase
MPLYTLKLFSKDGDEGWLTASYSNDKNNPSAIAFTKAESSINYEFLNDSKLHLPADFKVANGVVTYEGSIASDFEGVHKFRLTYGGYIKLWIDGKLLVDRWRVAWNPAIAMLNIALEKGKKYSIKIEWIPDGGESYLSLKWLNPIPEKDKNTYTFSSEAGKQLNYYFIYGDNMDEVISGYRQLTGKATMIPKWTFGFWQSRERYKTQDEILSTVAEFRKREIPLDNIVEDWSYWKENDWGSQEFDASRFSNPDSMINVLHKKYHTHFMISVWPKFYEGIPEYEYFNKNGWLYKRNVADRQRDWIGKGYVSTFYDAFNPGARKAFWDLLNERLYSKGVDAWWMDASEPDILSNVSPEKRKEQMRGLALGPAAEYLNAYPFQNAKGIYEGQRSVDSNKRVFILTRSAFAGQQRFAAATWSGDIAARWEDMKAQISAGINFSMSGIPYWTMDIGGFAVERRYEHPNEKDLAEWREQMTRWYQFGAFCPLFRVHGQFPFREIYNTAPEDHPAYKSMLFYDNLRYRLMPYIYSLAGAVYHNNYTIMRGLIMDFESDSLVKNIGDQYTYGPSLLINPVYTYKATNRKVYLPSGQGWYDLYSGKYTEGGQNITADAPYERMPVFVKEGSIIPFGPAMQYTNEKPEDPINLFVYTGKDASFNLYEDADTTYDYEHGAYTNIPITYNEVNKTLKIGKREGAFKGMLKNRTFKIIWISKDNPKPLNMDQKENALIRYNGKEASVRMK